jgi:signal transduction histidine kinase/ligand-binding sensor domain-containing protein
MGRLICILLCTFLLIHPVWGQGYKKAFLRISSDDDLGLNSNFVTALYQDPKGFIWVGTANGIQRFDGNKFSTVDTRRPGSEPLPEGPVRHLAGGKDGKVWILMDRGSEIGVLDPGLAIYRKVPLNPSGSLPPRAEFSLWIDSKDEVYLNILRYGKILRFDREKFEFNENTPLNNIPEGWKTQACVFEDTVLKRYWIVANKGLCVFDQASGQMWSEKNNPKKIKILEGNTPYRETTEFFIDKQRRHWFFYWTRAQEYHCFDEAGNPLPDTVGLRVKPGTYNELRKFLQTRTGSLWIYGLTGLHIMDSGQPRFTYYRSQYTDNFNIKYESVNAVIEDKDGIVWIATDQGLYYNIPGRNRVVSYFLSETPGYYNVTDLIQAPDGDYWVGTWGKGVLSIGKSMIGDAPINYASSPYRDNDNLNMFKQVWGMLSHSTGKVFLGCQFGRLMIYDSKTRKTEFLIPDEAEERTIRYLEEDTKGRVWMGTQAGRIIRYENGKFTVMYNLEETSMVLKILRDKQNGWMWVASHERGLFALHPETGKPVLQFNTQNGLFGNRVTDIEQLNDSILYVSASGILHIINKNSGAVKQLSTEDGLPSNTISRLRLDAKGYVWIITANGLCHYDWRSGRFTSFGKKDGIFLGDIVNKCDLIDAEGNVLFAGPNALISFNPDVYYNAPPPSSALITDFKIQDNYVLMDSLSALPVIRLKPNENSFSIYFSSLSFQNSGRFAYYYKLEGADKNWVRADATQAAHYRLLPPGKYTFYVKVENLDGVVSDKITKLSIMVKPQFWQTGWFVSLLMMIAAMVGYGMHRLRLNKILAVEKIRARVSRDLHDDMGSTLSTINILSSMAKSKLNTDPKKAGEYIGKIGDNSQRMMEAMDDIVWSIKPDNDTMERLIARMREFATSVLEAKDIRIKFRADEALNELKPDMETRRDLFLLFKEAVNNAAKYSKATEVSIEIEGVGKKIKMRIIDNGIGFDVNKADSGNGLGNMQRRSKTLNGQLTINSLPGHGTTIDLIAPLNTQ